MPLAKADDSDGDWGYSGLEYDFDMLGAVSSDSEIGCIYWARTLRGRKPAFAWGLSAQLPGPLPSWSVVLSGKSI